MRWPLLLVICSLWAGAALAATPPPGQPAGPPPWAVTATAGYAVARYRGDTDGAALPLISVSRVLDRHWEVRALAGGLAYHYDYYSSARTRQEAKATFTMAGIGVQVHIPNGVDRRPHVLLEVAPLVLHASWQDRSGSASRVLPGFWEAIGLSMPASRAVSVDFKIGYLFSRGTNEVHLDAPPTNPEGLNQGVVSCGVSVKLGHS